MTEEELDKKSTAIIEEYLHINDMKVQTVIKNKPWLNIHYTHVQKLNRVCFCVITGSAAVCAGDEQPSAALCVRTKRHGVDDGA